MYINNEIILLFMHLYELFLLLPVLYRKIYQVINIDFSDNFNFIY